MVGWTLYGGGAAEATRKIYTAISRNSADRAQPYLIQLRTIQGPTVDAISHQVGAARLSFLEARVIKFFWLWRRGWKHYILGRPSFLPTTADVFTGLGREILEQKPDIVHLFWLGNRTISIQEIGKIQRAGIPIVWTLSDCWPFSGIYHYPPDHKSAPHGPYRDYMESLREFRERNADKRILKLKRKNWKAPIHLVVKSSLLEEMARKSEISGDWPIHRIVNPISGGAVSAGEEKNFDSHSENTVRVGFGFLGSSSERKGASFAWDAAILTSKMLRERGSSVKIHLVLFGNAKRGDNLEANPNFSFSELGVVDVERMPELYAGLDLLLAPSLVDNSPNIVSEAIASGVPTVAFDKAGLSDLVVDMVTGLLVPKGDIQSFGEAILKISIDRQFRTELSRKARDFAAKNWSKESIAQNYLELYDFILSR